ncbi:bifunctional DNA-formamidopyrimidine glycosylase/DNA-(apurinic or apyrimidinic site) lyase [Mycoplasmopsis felis]|nr:bifunctional DNA-formamidopyrimidine glycosylase/DNA-(apurinic or apyrimidinic site) lyase [Mycoplasmopsis felis]
MREYPEVTVIQKSLNKYIQNQKIQKVEIKISKLIKNIEQYDFIKYLENKIILNVENFGKFLVFNLDDGTRLISHLRMSGKYFIREMNDPNLHSYKRDCIYFWLNNFVLVYNDSRMFGSFEIVNNYDKRTIYEIKNLAQLPDKVDPIELYKKLKSRNISIKKILLDQSLILGVGNIYADETLHKTGIYPMTPANQISLEELTNILKNASEIMEKSILRGGSSVHTYSSVNGISGKFQNDLLVYSRDKKECKTCLKDKIVKVKLDFKENGRGTSYCPTCQPRKEYNV